MVETSKHCCAHVAWTIFGLPFILDVLTGRSSEEFNFVSENIALLVEPHKAGLYAAKDFRARVFTGVRCGEERVQPPTGIAFWSSRRCIALCLGIFPALLIPSP